MILQPAILALLLAAAVSALSLSAAIPFALQLLRHWDLRSGHERQLALERRAHLVSTLLALLLPVHLLCLLLFVFNADHLAPLFVGAMCAVGTLHAAPFGFESLYLHTVLFFLAALWLALHHADRQAPDYPLLRAKALLLLALAPLSLLSFTLQLVFFLNLKADVITSCCSRLFTSGAPTTSSLAALPPRQALVLLFTVVALAAAAALHTAIRRRRAAGLLALAALLAFPATLAATSSALAPYVYEQPNHHCPFCLLKSDYLYQGYLLYLPLFLATATALSAGALQLLAQAPSLRSITPPLVARLARLAALGYLLLAAFSLWTILHSNLILIEPAPEKTSLLRHSH